jgi:hypothetical protein
MNPKERRTLETLAVKRLNATARDDEQWSFAFRTEGAIGLIYCPWSVTAEEEFDGEFERLELPWDPERLSLIKAGLADRSRRMVSARPK